MQINTILMRIRAFFTKKKIIWTIVILVLLFLGYLIFGKKSNTSNIQTVLVKQQDIQKTVLATGQVVSSTDLDLSWQSSGVVKKVLVKEGDVVHAGEVLAEQDTSDLVAQLHNAQAGLVLAQERASSSKSNLANVTAEQNILVQNAHRTLLNSTLSVLTVGDYSGSDAPTVSGTYSCDQEGTYDLKTYGSAGGVSVNYSGLEQGSLLLTDIPRPMGNCGLFLSFDKTKTLQSGVEFKINIPNKTATNYNTNYNAYQLALQNRDTAIAGAEANVGVTDSVAEAQIAQAQASVDSILIKIQNAKIIAPTSGTITQVDIKVGELAQASKEALKLLNVGELHAEALVSEADIASVAVGQSIDNTFDALGPDKHFTTKVLTVNPASTVISGVVNYKVTGSLEKIPEIKPGMTDNMTITVAEKKNVLVIPNSAIINKDNKRIVRVINDPKTKTYTEVPVETGLEADGGLTEIMSGLSLGQEVVTFIK
ncbi:MAG: efflux RND transporter periplasmic adaptor subunit [Candidatus Pacebacteria bacterium]|nr:efflux RND transporter periplasmic adaptor subunit [Candidatus Paceibacterota bacterium]